MLPSLALQGDRYLEETGPEKNQANLPTPSLKVHQLPSRFQHGNTDSTRILRTSDVTSHVDAIPLLPGTSLPTPPGCTQNHRLIPQRVFLPPRQAQALSQQAKKGNGAEVGRRACPSGARNVSCSLSWARLPSRTRANDLGGLRLRLVMPRRLEASVTSGGSCILIDGVGAPGKLCSGSGGATLNRRLECGESLSTFTHTHTHTQGRWAWKVTGQLERSLPCPGDLI